MDVSLGCIDRAGPDRPAFAADAPAAQPLALAATSRDALDAHLAALVERGGLEAFLAETEDAVQLSERSPVFADELRPLLGDIRDALAALPDATLSRVERDAVEATVARIDDHLAGVDGPDGAGEVPGGGLEAHEDVGGHLIERHVGKSEQWLLDRVSRENISAASSFRDLPEAEHFVSATIADHQARIDAWVDGAGGNRLVVDTTFDATTGISVSRGDTAAVDVFSVRLVLERSSQLDIGYRIVTGYPNKP
ncbi:RNase A-like domain-containing protein [Luteimonas sp. FCS-9]|uniref:RNase A-like domain-containing protein n=1 Tax=Luteimonas sp. FCS-9 TaxID=1547516 RepID=UPI00069CB3F3|nr:RNase A-like domain-containing protein [Luteimonas sp. FCS-9]